MVDCGILVSWDDQILKISRRQYGTPSKYRLPPPHQTTLLGDTSQNDPTIKIDKYRESYDKRPIRGQKIV